MEQRKNILISWIVPAYNVETFVLQCLKSLLSIGLKDEEYEILVIDDGSTDNTLKIILEYSRNLPNIKVLTQKNQGLSATRNRAIELANGDYIHFVDSDDYLINGKHLIDCIKFAEKNKLEIVVFNSKIVGFDSHPIDLKQGNSDYCEFSEIMDGQTIWEKFSFVNTAWTYIIKRQFVVGNNLMFVTGLLLEDFQFNINVFFKAKLCAITDAIIYCYRHNPSSIMHNTILEKQLRLLDSYIANAIYSRNFLESNDSILNDGAKQVVKDRGNRMLLYGVMRAFKIDKVRYFIRKLRKNNLYPFKWMTRPDYQMKKVNFFYRISQHETLTVFLSKIFKLYGKLNPKALRFDNW